MDAMDVMDALTAHAAAAAAAVDPAWTDVAIAAPLPRGRCVRVFYGGEREPEHFGEGRVLNARLIAEAVMVRAFWPVNDYGAGKGRALMAQQWAFVHELRTRTLADSQLDNKSSDLSMHLAQPDDVLIGGVHYALLDIEFVIDYGEYEVAV